VKVVRALGGPPDNRRAHATGLTRGNAVKPHALLATLLLAVTAFAGAVAGSGSAASSEATFAVASLVGSSTLETGTTISGPVVWTAAANDTPTKVEFLIDGKLRWTEHYSPYRFNGDATGLLDTTNLGDGRHNLKVRAYRSDGKTTTTKARILVANGRKPPRKAFSVTSSIGTGAALSGSLSWSASPSGAPVSKVEFLVDGPVKWTEATAPYEYNGDGQQLDTKTLSDGAHTLAVKATATDGRTAIASSSVSVTNASVPPPPPPYVVTSSVTSGATISGSIAWTASPSGTTTSKIDFLVDGTVKSTDSSAPYQYNGDGGQLDTTTLVNGSHTLAVNAYATDSRTASASSAVTVSNAAPLPAFAVTSSIASGATLDGSETWTASPAGSAASKVEFLIDGVVKWTEMASPYQFNTDPNGVLDTRTLSNGAHVLKVIAYATDGRTVSASSSVTVSNTSVSTGSIPRFGIATGYKILTRSASDQAFELDNIKAAGAKLVRFDSLPGNQTQVDSVVDGVRARGMESILVLFGTTGVVSPSAAASFASSQATKWKGRVRLYEFTNEPDLHGWNGTNYAQALIPVYNAIKAADPNAIVIAGALWKGAGGPVQFVTDMYNAGAKGHFDVLSLHLYDDPFAAGTWNIWNMAFHMSPSVRSVMDAHGDQAIPIGATEAGGPIGTYGENGQATIVGHDFDALANDPRLAFVCVYSMMDDDVTGFGLLRGDRSKRPAWSVYANRAN
jgi:Cellulase (glycosyl hydrolase family 5)/Bacterial Ig domain